MEVVQKKQVQNQTQKIQVQAQKIGGAESEKGEKKKQKYRHNIDRVGIRCPSPKYENGF